MSRPILIDGDIIAYRAASATDGRIYEVSSDDLPSYFKNKKEAVAFQEEHGGNIELMFFPDPLSYSLQIVKNYLEAIKDEWGDNLYIFLSGKRSFRESINPHYKSSRDGLRRPVHLKDTKTYLIEKHKAVLEEGKYEADDLLAIYNERYEDAVIVSVDKDLKQCPGTHYNPVTKVTEEVSEVEGLRNFYTQLLIGDKTDDIEGIYGIGPKKAEKILKDCNDEDSMYHKVHHTWFTMSDVKTMEVSAQMLYLLRSEEDKWRPPYERRDSKI